ncbi:MAG: hypothetical protein AB7G11_11970 [Phycisphaerales bacterium]
MLSSRPGVRLEYSLCGYDAFARVLRQSQQDEAARRAASAPPTGHSVPRTPIVLLMVEPADLDLASPTFEAARRFAPHAACWQFETTGSPRLRPAASSDAQQWTAPAGACAHASPTDSRRIAGFVPGVVSRAGPSRVSASS